MVVVNKVGIEKETGASYFSIVPNPTNDNFTITYKLPENEVVGEIVIYDVYGAIMDKLLITGSHGKIVYPAKKFSAGVYFCLYGLSKDIIETKKLIITK